MTLKDGGVDQNRAVLLRDGLRKERRIYEALSEISRQQDEIIRSGATDEILSLARAKEAELSRIQEIESELGDLKKNWPNFRDQIEGPLRQEVERELEAIEGVLRQLIELETQGQRDLEGTQRETAAKLKQVDGGRKLHRAYAASPARQQSRYLDKRE